MSNGVVNRDDIIFTTLREELVGPCAYGKEIDVTSQEQIPLELLNIPSVDKATGEEILKLPPLQRYGVGVIYPMDEGVDSNVDSTISDVSESDSAITNSGDALADEEVEFKGGALKDVADSGDDFDISLANARLPSSVGLSVLISNREELQLKFCISGGYYKDFTKTAGGARPYTWWLRCPVFIEFEVPLGQLGSSFKMKLSDVAPNLPNEYLKLFCIEGVVRNHDDGQLITVALVNRNVTDTYADRNRAALFQAKLSLECELDGENQIFPYPEPVSANPEDISNQLLYRQSPVFGKGHGVACDWELPAYEAASSVKRVFTESLPTFETPSVSADVTLSDGTLMEVKMADLCDMEPGGVGDQQLQGLVKAYEGWIVQQESLISGLSSGAIQQAARSHLIECRSSLARISEGAELIRTNEMVRRAFELANEAMLEQQKHAPKKLRTVAFDSAGHPYCPEPYRENLGAKGVWRPFQIGFLLMSLSGVFDPSSDDREKVDLIWFPTGGGKTEAYLGLAAFMLLYERLTKRESADGLQVLMRYTLRLLTAQQLQRAATLICCLEVVRKNENISGRPFSIGLWVGGKNTPNTRGGSYGALAEFKKMNRAAQAGRHNISNPFLLDRCPYCGAAMGLVPNGKSGRQTRSVVGYGLSNDRTTVIYSCVDSSCVFSDQVPVYVIDEDIYENKPSVVIATVDKLALLAWKPEIRRLFGLSDDGERVGSPPQLVIQDELHLISGPLGSMVALYEPVIEKLCSQNIDGKLIKPKIVCATATTKGYKQQIAGIYGRAQSSIFPPPGLSAEDSFFAKYARGEDGKLLPGRKYVGVCAPGLGSILTTQVRSQSALLFASNRLQIEERDPWVTLLVFYNSIRELGGALTLFQSDIVSYLLELKRRYPEWLLPRRHLSGIELTSRLADDEVPKAISVLEQSIDFKFIDEAFLKSLCKELQKISTTHSPLKGSCDVIIDSINRNNHVSVEGYFNVELIRLYLYNLPEKITLPPGCKKLLEACSNFGVHDFCLASSIIEVGVDIDRLSLMSIVGQPKTTAQYIQVSGRVGRRPDERPGLVVTLYNNSKPRDKSHYEDFRGYHQRLYARVEPASVTGFSRPALKRGLAAVTVANIRQFQPIGSTPGDIPASAIKNWHQEFIDLRGAVMTDEERNDVDSFFGWLADNWDKKTERFTEWGRLDPNKDPEATDLLVPLGVTGNFQNKLKCPTSMRNVDGESELWICQSEQEENFGGWI